MVGTVNMERRTTTTFPAFYVARLRKKVLATSLNRDINRHFTHIAGGSALSFELHSTSPHPSAAHLVEVKPVSSQELQTGRLAAEAGVETAERRRAQVEVVRVRHEGVGALRRPDERRQTELGDGEWRAVLPLDRVPLRHGVEQAAEICKRYCKTIAMSS